MTELLIPGVLLLLVVLGLLDGARAIFRGTRDHLLGTGCNDLSARVSGGIVAAFALFSGVAGIVGLLAIVGRGRNAVQPTNYTTEK